MRAEAGTSSGGFASTIGMVLTFVVVLFGFAAVLGFFSDDLGGSSMFYPVRCQPHLDCKAESRVQVRVDFATQRVVWRQYPNGSVSPLENCIVLNSDNWSCNSHYLAAYEFTAVHDGHYTHEYLPVTVMPDNEKNLTYVSKWTWWRAHLIGPQS